MGREVEVEDCVGGGCCGDGDAEARYVRLFDVWQGYEVDEEDVCFFMVSSDVYVVPLSFEVQEHRKNRKDRNWTYGRQYLHLIILDLEQDQRSSSSLRFFLNILALVFFVFALSLLIYTSILLFLFQKICADHKVVSSHRAKLDTARR